MSDDGHINLDTCMDKCSKVKDYCRFVLDLSVPETILILRLVSDYLEQAIMDEAKKQIL